MHTKYAIKIELKKGHIKNKKNVSLSSGKVTFINKFYLYDRTNYDLCTFHVDFSVLFENKSCFM